MRAHFTPPDESKFMRKHGHQDAPKRHVVARYNGYPAFNYMRPSIEKPAEPRFRRRMRTRASNRRYAIDSAALSEAFTRNVHDVAERPGFLRRLMETPEETAARKADELAKWKERFLAEQRYLKPRLHPKNMINPEKMFSGRVGRIEGFNLITDAFISGDATHDTMPQRDNEWTRLGEDMASSMARGQTLDQYYASQEPTEHTKKDLDGLTQDAFFEKADDGKCVKIERHSNPED